MNRFMDRMARFGKSWPARRGQGTMVETSAKAFDPAAPPDVMSTRAKSTGHGKKTADKWNQ